MMTGFLVALLHFISSRSKSFHSLVSSMSTGGITGVCEQGQPCPQLCEYKFTCSTWSNLSTYELQMSVESVTQITDCLPNMLVCEYLMLSQLFDVQMSFICTLIHCIGYIIVDLDIMCHFFYICKIGTDKLVKKFLNRFDHKIQFDRGGHHHPGFNSWSDSWWPFLYHIFPLFLWNILPVSKGDWLPHIL